MEHRSSEEWCDKTPQAEDSPLTLEAVWPISIVDIAGEGSLNSSHLQSTFSQQSTSSRDEKRIMPKAASSSTSKSPVKSEPYDAAASPKKTDSKPRATKSGPGIWTAEIDQDIIRHVLSNSNITLTYNWPELVKRYPEFTIKQVQNHWDYKLKPGLFPSGVLKMSKNAKGGK